MPRIKQAIASTYKTQQSRKKRFDDHRGRSPTTRSIHASRVAKVALPRRGRTERSDRGIPEKRVGGGNAIAQLSEAFSLRGLPV